MISVQKVKPSFVAEFCYFQILISSLGLVIWLSKCLHVSLFFINPANHKIVMDNPCVTEFSSFGNILQFEVSEKKIRTLQNPAKIEFMGQT